MFLIAFFFPFDVSGSFLGDAITLIVSMGNNAGVTGGLDRYWSRWISGGSATDREGGRQSFAVRAVALGIMW